MSFPFLIPNFLSQNPLPYHLCHYLYQLLFLFALSHLSLCINKSLPLQSPSPLPPPSSLNNPHSGSSIQQSSNTNSGHDLPSIPPITPPLAPSSASSSHFPHNVHPMVTGSKNGIIKPRLHPTLLLTHLESTSVKQALADPTWFQAMTVEFNALLKSQTWTLVDLPDGRESICCKWVFRIKENPDGSVQK